MSDLPPIRDPESLEALLKTRPIEDAVIIAERIAMRVLPLWPAAIALVGGQNADLTAIPILRLNLAVAVARKMPAPDTVLDATRAAFASAPDDTRIANRTASTSARHIFAATSRAALAARGATARSAASRDASASASKAVKAAFAAAPDAAGDLIKNVKHDIDQLIVGDAVEQMLWSGPNPIADQWRAALPVLHEAPGGEFWIDWYQRALDGRPQNWPLLRDIVLIDDALWEQDGNALDREINRIVERHGLLHEVRRLKAGLVVVSEPILAPPHRLHNRPPESVDVIPDPVILAVTKIPELLEEAERELQQPAPSLSRLRRIGLGIKEATKSVLDYNKGFAGAFLTNFSKEAGSSFGKYAGPALLAGIVSQSQTITGFVERLAQFAGP